MQSWCASRASLDGLTLRVKVSHPQTIHSEPDRHAPNADLRLSALFDIGSFAMRIIEHRAPIQHRIPIDAEAVVYNSLADTLTLGPLTFEEDALTPKEREEELEHMAGTILGDLLQHYQLKKRDKPPTIG